MDVVIPAGGTINAAYAMKIGTPYRALAPMGPERRPAMQIVVDALRGSGCAARIIGVAPAEVAASIAGVDDWVPCADSGAANVLAGLARARQVSPALVCASDLPLMTSGAVREFAERCRTDAGVSIGLVRADTYHAAFPDAPPSEFVTIRETGPVTLSCLFQVHPAAAERHRELLMRTFSARKSQWRMAGLLGPRLLVQWATRSLTLSTVIARGEHVLQARLDILPDVAPVLACDMDTADDYTYADITLQAAARCAAAREQ